MIDIPTIMAALGMARAASETALAGTNLVKSLKDSETDQSVEEVRGIASDLAGQLFQARQAMLTVQTQLEALLKQAEADNRFAAVRGLYRADANDAGGAILRLKQADEAYFSDVCPVCVEKDGSFLPLQFVRDRHFCTNCKGMFPPYPNVAVSVSAGA